MNPKIDEQLEIAEEALRRARHLFLESGEVENAQELKKLLEVIRLLPEEENL